MKPKAVNRVPSYKPSYWHNPGPEPLSSLTLGQLIDAAAETWKDKEAIISVYQGLRYTFSEVREKATRLAAGLTQLGLSRGDRLGIWGPNSYEWYISRMAAAKGGFIAVQIEPAYQAPQLLYSLTKVDAKALICPDGNFYDILSSIVPELKNYEESGAEINAKQVPSLKTVILMSKKPHRGAYLLNDVINSATNEYLEKINELQNVIQPDDGCNIQFSSGTTGFPKAVLLSHHALVNNGYILGHWIRTESTDPRIVLPTQFCHASGTILGFACNLVMGRTIILPAPMFDAKKTVDAIIHERGTIMFGTPTLYVDMMNVVTKEKLQFPSLEVIQIGGAPCAENLALKIKNVFGAKILQPLYGMTEISIPIISSTDDPLEKTTSTVGCVTDHLEAKVINNTGQMTLMGEPGELCVRGYSLLKKYWADKEKTEEFKDPDGWAKTGDLAVMQEGGYIKIVGRIKDIIIRIGDKIFPAELEEFFLQNPDIIDAQVLGVPDPRTGEEICAFFRLREGSNLTQQEIVNYCKGKIPDYRIPRYIKIVDEFPRSAIGKVVRYKLLEIIQKEIGNQR